MAGTLTDEGQSEGQDEERAESEPPARTVRISFRSVDSLIAYGIIVAVVGWRAWAALQWTFQRDDWRFVAAAARLPFLDFITMQYVGHLQPGQLALVWLATRAAPLNYFVAILPLLLVTGLAGVLMWKLLGALFGERPANLVPLAVFMLCPLSTRSALWLAASLTIFLQFFIVASLLTTLLYVRQPSGKRLALVVVTYAGALLYWEKSLLILPLLGLFVVLFLGPGRGWERVRHVTLGLWRMWVALAGLTMAYLIWYVAVVSSPLTHHPTATEVRRLSFDTFGYAVIPSYLGGPWRAPSVGRAAVYQLPLVPRALALLAFVAIVAVSILLYRQAWRAWLLPFAYLVMALGLVAVSRVGVVGPIVGLDTRYTADSVPVFALALALAFMVPKDREGDPAWTRRTVAFDVGSRTWSLGSAPPDGRGGRWSPAAKQRGLALGLVAAYAVSALITNTALAGLADKYSIKAWLANVRTGIDRHPAASIVDGFLPPAASPIRALTSDDVALSRMLAPIAPHVRWNGPGERMYMFDEDGQLLPAKVAPVETSRPGPARRCGYLLNQLHRTARVDIDNPLPERRRWGIWVGYFSRQGANGDVTIDDDRQDVTFLPGLHPVYLVHKGAVDTVDLEIIDNPVCVSYVRIGPFHPVSPEDATSP